MAGASVVFVHLMWYDSSLEQSQKCSVSTNVGTIGTKLVTLVLLYEGE